MRSAAGSEPLDLGHLVVTPEDVRALRRARALPSLRTADLLRVLARMAPPLAVLRARKGPCGSEPFRL